MILVTGTGRCGSSLMMQTLHLLGIPTIGGPLDDDDDEDFPDHLKEEFTTRIRELNPKGYWELPIETIIEMCNNGFTKGSAIKIIGGLTQEINPEDIEKMVICDRHDRVAQAESMYKLSQLELSMQEHTKIRKENLAWFENKDTYDILHQQEMTMILIDNLSKHYDIPTKTIHFEDFLTKPKETVESLVNFLDLKDVDINNAIKNVDTR